MYTYVPSLPPPHPSSLGPHRAPSRAPCAIQQLPTSCLFYTGRCIHSNAIAQFIPPSPSSTVSTYPSSTPASLFLPCIYLYHFSRFHVYVLICSICPSLSDLLHSVWQTLAPPTSLQMTQFHSFLWLSNIPGYICTTPALSIHLLMDI